MQKQPSVWLTAFRRGLVGGTISLLLCLVGMVPQFTGRYIISGVISVGQVLAVAPILIMGWMLGPLGGRSFVKRVLLGALTGLAGGLILGALVLLGEIVNLRSMFINASPELFALLTFNLGFWPGILVLLGFCVLLGAVGAAIQMLQLVPGRPGSVLLSAILWVIIIGTLRDLIVILVQNWGPAARIVTWMFAQSGLTLLGTTFILVVTGGLPFLWRKVPAAARLWIKRISWALLGLLLIFFPGIGGPFLSDIADNVGLFILMGLGLNIVVGFAGLLDLGYVAFFAIGAYTMGVLTSPERIATPLTYWEALPIALLVSVLSGVILGLPVLKMRGDYLAIVTLGFGEIVRLLVLSDWLEPMLGGTQGIQLIAHPVIGPLNFGSQQWLYYIIMAFIGVAIFIAVRLKDSHLGRSWMALREDEDVAKAMGINHVTTKLLAFASGAFFAGLAGTLFAAKLSSAYPQSFQFLVSINVLSLIILGGMGSIPGVIIGGVFLIAPADLLREFAEYRYLVYGAVLVAMMLNRPEGLLPEARRELELHEAEDEALAEAEPSPVPEARS